MSWYDKQKLSAAVKAKLEAEKLRSTAVADSINVSRSTFSRIGTGKRSTGNIETIYKICDWLGANVEDFTGGQSPVVLTSGDTLKNIETVIKSDSSITENHQSALMELMAVAYRRFRSN
jgi:DNA-binding Xre family transcriptional regulator